MYDKIITPHFEQIGKRKKLIDYTGELYDGNILLHSQSYDTNSQAEQALDRIVFDLLTDLHEHGMVDDVPAALEAEQVSSTHLPSWPDAYTLAAEAGAFGPQEMTWDIDNSEYCPAHETWFGRMPCPACYTEARQPAAPPTCQNCQGPHHTWQCPEIGDLLFAEPVVMVLDIEYAPFGFAV